MWARDQDDRKSTSFRVGNATVSWGSKKQSWVTLSTAEAEYMSLTMAAKEGIWLNRLLAEMNMRTISQQFACLRTRSFIDAASTLT